MKFKAPLFFLSGSIINLLITPSIFAAKTANGIMVWNDVKHDISLPLRDIPIYSKPQELVSKIENILTLKNSLIHVKAFQGIGVGLGSYIPTSPSPQVAGSVGLTQYVQWVEPDFAIFDKATGSVLSGFPKPGKTLWLGFGGPCETQDSGTSNVKFDKITNRWLFVREAFENTTTGPFFVCAAVSTTEDAAGSYYRYAFPMDSLSKYGSIGVWNDSYLLALTMFGSVTNGPRACALEKDKMLLGQTASIQCNQLTFEQSDTLRAVNYSGGITPIGYPGYFFSLNSPANILMFKFSVDWNNPSNSHFSSAIKIPVNTFFGPCPAMSGNSCVVQPGITTRLDVLGNAFPSRINFRQFPDHSSFLMTHNIEGPPPKRSVALRWYELRMMNNPTANPIVYQQQTLAPDSKARFTGAITIDKSQNMALAYTVSSSAIHPSPEMGYRNYFDPLNNLTIQPLFTGTGSQTVSSWTNYSSMVVDPIDDCSFWFTSPYLKTDGSFNWSTAIIKFKMASCV